MFKKLSKRPPLRAAASAGPRDGGDGVSDDDDDTEELAALSEVRERQRMRGRPRGVDVEELNAGAKLYPPAEEAKVVDPFKTLTGGLVDRNTLKKRCDQADDAYDTGIGTTFSAETNLRDEDDEMRRFIEAELAKRTGKGGGGEEDGGEAGGGEGEKFLSPEDAALQAIPDALKITHRTWSEKNEEMLSSQMLSGIPEVDLGMEAKIKNIEATEAAKNRILLERMQKKDLPSEFVPTNMAVNFVQHNRYNLDDGSGRRGRGGHQYHNRGDRGRGGGRGGGGGGRDGGHRRGPGDAGSSSSGPGYAGKSRDGGHRGGHKRPPEKKIVVGVDGEATLVTEMRAARRPGEERATDDFAYEKFKKQFKKH